MKFNAWNKNEKFFSSKIAQNVIATACGSDINTACGSDVTASACGSDINTACESDITTACGSDRF